jgi:hypothetical protein
MTSDLPLIVCMHACVYLDVQMRLGISTDRDALAEQVITS